MWVHWLYNMGELHVVGLYMHCTLTTGMLMAYYRACLICMVLFWQVESICPGLNYAYGYVVNINTSVLLLRSNFLQPNNALTTVTFMKLLSVEAVIIK